MDASACVHSQPRLTHDCSSTKWTTDSAPFRLELIRSTSRSIGDAMRDLDNRGVMSNDFVVVYGDVVSNLPLDEVLAVHRERRAKDKNAIMTMVLREVSSKHPSKARGSSPVFVIDPTKDRCLHYEQMLEESETRRIELNEDVLAEPEIELRNDLIDCGIDICTPDVLALWSDNFDYEAPRSGFLHSVLKDYELNGKTIHTHIINHHYAARVRNLHAYGSISKDVLGRWAYPFSPDTNLFDGQAYSLGKNQVYLEEGLELSRTTTIGSRSMVGRGTVIGPGSTVRNTIIGRGVKIGKDCHIRNAFIWDNVTLGDGVDIDTAVIGTGSSIGSSSKILEGCLVTFDVKVPENVTLKSGRRLVRRRLKSRDTTPAKEPEAAEDFSPSESEEEDTRAGLKGYRKSCAEIPLDRGANLTSLVYSTPGAVASTESISTINSDLDEGEDVQPRHTSTGSFASVASDDTTADYASKSFVDDASNSIYDSLKKGHDVSTIQLELQGLRMAADASQHNVRRAVALGLTKHLLELTKPHADSRAKTLAVNGVLKSNKILIERTMFDKGDDFDEKPDQVDFLLLAQSELVRKTDGDTVLHDLVAQGYNLDLLEPEGIEEWWADERSSASEELKKVRAKTEAVIKTLADMDEESDEEDESDAS